MYNGSMNARPIEPKELINEWKKHILALYEMIKG